MADIDFKRLLDEPIYAFDFQCMIGDIQDFLDVFESNAEERYRQELRKVRQEEGTGKWPPEYREQYGEHRRANAEHRFKASLPLRVRYGAVIALSTSVEWSVGFLKARLRTPLGRAPRKRNKTVHALCEIQERTKAGGVDLVKDYEALVCVRNCIAHSAGIEEHYKFRDKLPAAVERLGFSLDDRLMIGKHIWIERDSLNRHIQAMGRFIVELHKIAHDKGLLRDSN